MVEGGQRPGYGGMGGGKRLGERNQALPVRARRARRGVGLEMHA